MSMVVRAMHNVSSSLSVQLCRGSLGRVDRDVGWSKNNCRVWSEHVDDEKGLQDVFGELRPASLKIIVENEDMSHTECGEGLSTRETMRAYMRGSLREVSLK